VRSEEVNLYHEYEDHSLQGVDKSPFTNITNGEFNWFLILCHVMGCRQKYRYTYSHSDSRVPSSSSQIRHLKRRSHVAPLIDNNFHGNQSSSMQVFDTTPLSKNAKGEYSNPFMNFLYICGTNIGLLTLTYN